MGEAGVAQNQCDQTAWLFLAIYNCDNLPFSKRHAKVGWNFCLTVNKPARNCKKHLKFCQSGEKLPILVSLLRIKRKWKKERKREIEREREEDCSLEWTCGEYGDREKFYKNMAAIAQYIRLCLSSCGPGFESQAHHLCLFHYSQILDYICHCVEKRTFIKKKRPSLAHFF